MKTMMKADALQSKHNSVSQSIRPLGIARSVQSGVSMWYDTRRQEDRGMTGQGRGGEKGRSGRLRWPRSWLVETYSNRAQKMMMTMLNVKIFAIPSAKPRIIDSTPSLQSRVLVFTMHARRL